MKTKQEIWTSSDSRLSITVTNNGRGLLTKLTMCGETYDGFVASTTKGHHIMFFPRLGLHGKWGVPCLYDLTDDLGNRHQWLFDADRYRHAVDELDWAIKNFGI